MLHDLLLAYNFPEDDVIYLFYELKNSSKNKNCKTTKKNNAKNELNAFNLNYEKSNNPFENIEYFESKRKPFSNLSDKSPMETYENNNNSQNKSMSIFSFSQRLPFKQTENFHSLSNPKVFNLNEKSSNNYNDNNELSRFLKKNSENGENFPAISQFFDREKSKTYNSLLNFEENKLRTTNSVEEINKPIKIQQRLQKINEIIDIFGKNNETNFANFNKKNKQLQI